jgi:UDP-N-acetylmuramoyl-tripeptide--D-alanyl-D-alanine ligase
MEFFNTGNPHLYIAILLSILNAGLLAFLSGKFLQVIQQSGYKIKGYNTWLRGTRYKYLSRLFTLGLLSFFCAIVSNTLLDVYHSSTLYSYIGLIFYFYFSIVLVVNLVKEENKIPLVKTKRIGRWVSLLFLLYFAISFILIAVSTEFILVIRFGIITITPSLVPFIVVLAFYMILPIELLINKFYIKKAQNKLRRLKKLKIVAITGSYAKTSNKFILHKMLSKKFNTIASPRSFNTPLGLTRTILQDITPEHEIFIAEFGAKKVKEIKELSQFIKPHYGMITGVGNQHLETFKTQENIIKTKFELAEYLKNSLIVFNGDNKINNDFYKNYQNQNKLITYKKDKNGFAYCKSVKATYKGTNFTLVIDRNEVKCQTKLLGIHNLENFAMCAALAYKLGVSLPEIAEAISEIEPVKHRLEIVNNDENYIIVDDSFNASVEGTTAAINTIALFEKHTKIIVTPGIVEMGKLETNVNFEFGKQIANVFDFAIVVNEINKGALVKGMKESNFSNDKIFFVESLKQVQEVIEKIKAAKTVVLFENDLPDLFIY